MSGTSMATPAVDGFAARLRGRADRALRSRTRIARRGNGRRDLKPWLKRAKCSP